MPGSNSSKPPLQRLIEGIGIIATGFFLIAGLWGNISDSIGLITTKFAFAITGFVLIISLALWIWAKYRGIKWNHDGSTVVYREFNAQAWLWLTGVLVAIWLGPFISIFSEKDKHDASITEAGKPYILECNFPKSYNRDTLYILVTRFEADANKVETGCFGKALRDRIDAKANQHRIPIKICYSDSLYPKTHT